MFFRPVRTSQPQGPSRIDWGNPITRGLVDAASLANLRSVKGFAATLTGDSTLNADVGGVGYLAAGAGQDRAVFQNPELRVTGAFTSLAFYKLKSVPTGARRVTGTLNNAVFGYAISPNATNFRAIFATSGGTATLIGEPISARSKIDVLVHNGTQGIFYENGRLTAGPTSGVYTPASGLSHFSVGKDSNSTGLGADAITYAWAVWNRALSDAEVKSLSDNPWQVFASDSKALWTPAAVSVTLPTLVQPISTTSAGAWVATGAGSLHAAINELVPSDTQYISVNSASTTEMLLGEAAYPGASNQTLAYRASSTQGSTLTVTLKQGATIIMTRTHTLTATDTLYTQTLTAPEIATITAGAISVTLTTS